MKIKKHLTQALAQSILFMTLLLQAHFALASTQTVNLLVTYKTMNLAGKSVQAIVVNNQLPGPTLHFKEGDHVTINVTNHLDKGTSIHWHGLIVPWNMDGVEGVSQAPIPPGGVFHYQFTLKQSGTYWYHAHTGFQEQQGLYGAIIIDPLHSVTPHYTKDYVIVLSDWSNTRPEQIYANLKKEGDYYSPNFPLQPSLSRFLHDYRQADPKARQELLMDYKMMQQMRMSFYDFSDVAYDAFLLNGRPKNSPWTAPVKVGDVVRLRFIDAGASTIFHIKIPGATMQVIQVQGHSVVPYTVNDFTLASGETLDVLVKIVKDKPALIYAESSDTLGATVGGLLTHPQQKIDYQTITPFPTPAPINMMGSMDMTGMASGSSSMNMEMHSESSSMKPVTSNKKAMATMHSHHAMSSMNGDKMSMAGMDHSSPSMNMHNETSQSAVKPAPQPMQMNASSHTMSMGSMSMNHDMSAMAMDEMKMPASVPATKTNAAPTSMSMNTSISMDHSKMMNMPTSSEPMTDSVKYTNLKELYRTNDPNKPYQVIHMKLSGYMDRYIWFINDVPESKAKPILIEPGKRYRLIFVNKSMMHHPMHIHGHWFILRNGHGAYDPLLHTLDIAPGETVVADFDADASGQWIFHCHFLYHMMAGMTRVFRYTSFPEDVAKVEAQPKQTSKMDSPASTGTVNPPAEYITPQIIHHPMGEMPGLFRASYLDAGFDPFSTIQQITFKSLFGGDNNKLELFTNEAEIQKGTIENADMDFFYWHLISEFWAIKGGVNYFYRPTSSTPYWQPGIGLEGLMPFFIDTNIRTYFHQGSIKLDAELSRDTQITDKFFIRGGIRSILATKTVAADQIGSGLNEIELVIRPYYQLNPAMALFTEFEHTQYYGPLVGIRQNAGESTNENILTFGVSLLF